MMLHGEATSAPPVNNLLQPDVYNRLDAQVLERTRVVNAQLDHRLLAQQNILAKYRVAAERFYRREKNVVTKELRRISTKLPAVSRIRHFRSKFFYGEGLHNTLSHSMPDVRLKKVRGIPKEKPDQPFCHRYFIHHLPTKTKYYKAAPPSPAFLARGGADTEEGNGVGVSLPPLTGTEFPTVQGDVHKRSVTPTEHASQPEGCAAVHDVRSVTRNAHRLPSKSDTVAGARNGNGSFRLSGKGGQSDRKTPSQFSGRTRILPPIVRQNLRLAHSSPQLFHG